MLIHCSECGKKFDIKDKFCSHRCRMRAWRDKNITSDKNVIKNKTKSDKTIKYIKHDKPLLPDLVKNSEKKIKEIRYNNPFEICKKHSVYKRSCGCK